VGPGASIVVCSDHGFRFEPNGLYNHLRTSPDGVLILQGPEFAAGRSLDRVHVRDLAPTLLALLGEPVSREMEGRPVSQALLPGSPRAVVAYIESFGAPWPAQARRPRVLEGEVEEGLRALGYVN